MQFIENILLLQCLKKETATAREHYLRPLGKVIIFRDRQTHRQNLPIIYRWTPFLAIKNFLSDPSFNKFFYFQKNGVSP